MSNNAYFFLPIKERLPDLEFQSAILRIIIFVMGASYVGYMSYHNQIPISFALFSDLTLTYLIVFTALLAHTWKIPNDELRPFFAIFADVSAISVGIFLTGDAQSPFYLFYIWVFVTCAVLFDKKQVYYAGVITVIFYGSIVIALGQWINHVFTTGIYLSLLFAFPALNSSLLEQLRQAKLQAETANLAKTQFLANMSHELRTPLNGISGMITLLQNTANTAEQQLYIDDLQTSADLLKSIIGDVLDFSKIEAGKLQLERQSISIRELVEASSRLYAQGVFSKGVEFICHVDTGIPSNVIGDALRIRQVLHNLISNATKFTQSGTIFVRARTSKITHDVVLEVEDTGIGIAKEHLDHLYEEFWQADVTITRNYGGTGLGTAIINQLVKLMNGKITCCSELGKGSCFSITLPLPPVVASLTQTPSLIANKHVLIIETNPDHMKVIVEYCAALGLKCTQLESIAAIMTNVHTEKVFDAILFCPALQDTQTEDTLEKLKIWFAPTPIILVAAMDGKTRSKSSQYDGIFYKPLSLLKLTTTLEQVLLVNDCNFTKITAAASTTQVAHIIHILIAEDNEINLRVLTSFLADSHYHLTLTRNGQEALVALRKNRYDIALIDLHMPLMGGIEFTRRWRSHEMATMRIPIIALTANTSSTIRDDCIQAGMDDLLLKPVDRAQLLDIIEHCADTSTN